MHDNNFVLWTVRQNRKFAKSVRENSLKPATAIQGCTRVQVTSPTVEELLAAEIARAREINELSKSRRLEMASRQKQKMKESLQITVQAIIGPIREKEQQHNEWLDTPD